MTTEAPTQVVSTPFGEVLAVIKGKDEVAVRAGNEQYDEVKTPLVVNRIPVSINGWLRKRDGIWKFEHQGARRRATPSSWDGSVTWSQMEKLNEVIPTAVAILEHNRPSLFREAEAARYSREAERQKRIIRDLEDDLIAAKKKFETLVSNEAAIRLGHDDLVREVS